MNSVLVMYRVNIFVSSNLHDIILKSLFFLLLIVYKIHTYKIHTSKSFPRNTLVLSSITFQINILLTKTQQAQTLNLFFPFFILQLLPNLQLVLISGFSCH
ncbi:hypothetical protein QVD17_26022 [Tagetes erecta]|uniref:Uncharacterized protein n=1 Tax=Tagetes erecta TaxID=13708 RepID=A0AAD8K851_TARER|nr:hypothetical protein QVD17_26022 [Tagetes erecta]